MKYDKMIIMGGDNYGMELVFATQFARDDWGHQC